MRREGKVEGARGPMVAALLQQHGRVIDRGPVGRVDAKGRLEREFRPRLPTHQSQRRRDTVAQVGIERIDLAGTLED